MTDSQAVSYVLPGVGQTMVSPSGKAWKVMRVWRDSDQRRGVALMQVDGAKQSISRYLDTPVNRGNFRVPVLGQGWRLRLDRQRGAFRVCPVCEAQFGGMSRCPWDDVELLHLDIAHAPQPDDAIGAPLMDALRAEGSSA